MPNLLYSYKRKQGGNNGGLTNPVDGSSCVFGFWCCSGIVTDDGRRREFTQRATDAPHVVPSALTFSLCIPAPTSTAKEASHHYHKCQPSCLNIHTCTGMSYWVPLCFSQVASYSLFYPTMACKEVIHTPQHNFLLVCRLWRWMGGVTWIKKSRSTALILVKMINQSIFVFCWFKQDFDLMQKSQVNVKINTQHIVRNAQLRHEP